MSGLRAKGLRTFNVSKSNTTLIFLNQIRMKIGVMFGNPETTTGGNALKFYASLRMEIRRIGQIKDRSHWNSPNLVPQDPVTLGLCTQIDLDAEVRTHTCSAWRNSKLARSNWKRKPAIRQR